MIEPLHIYDGFDMAISFGLGLILGAFIADAYRVCAERRRRRRLLEEQDMLIFLRKQAD
jgi:hypothetical protein